MATVFRPPLLSRRQDPPPIGVPFVAANLLALGLLISPLPQVTQLGDWPTPQHPSHALSANADTSAGSFTPLLAVTQPPFTNQQVFLVPRISPVADTSQSAFAAGNTAPQAPFTPYLITPPDSVRPASDTSQSAFLTLQPVPAPPIFNFPYLVVHRPVAAADTSQQTNIALGVPPAPDVVPDVRRGGDDVWRIEIWEKRKDRRTAIKMVRKAAKKLPEPIPQVVIEAVARAMAPVINHPNDASEWADKQAEIIRKILAMMAERDDEDAILLLT